MLKILSWGCGVQSTALAAMAALEDLPRLDAIITADTGWERQATYQIRDWYKNWLEDRGLSVFIVSSGNIRDDGAKKHIHIPFWTDSGGPLLRQCTGKFKIIPIKHQIRRLLGHHPSKPPHPPPESVELWLGISLDEYTRMKSSRVQYITHRYPLIERRLSRRDCINYLEENGLPVPIKSACVGCPYRSASEWAKMKKENPAEWQDAIEFDEENRDNPLAGRGGSTSDKLYIYQNGGPLAKADLIEDAKREKKSKQLPLLICDSGYCFV